MLRDESARQVGAARGEAVPFPAPERDLSAAEKAWIHLCQVRKDPQGAPLEGICALTAEAVRRCRLTPAAAETLNRHGWRGRRPRQNTTDRKVWDQAMQLLAGELRNEGIAA